MTDTRVTKPEIDVDTEIHWGSKYPSGVVCWNPSYGRGNGYETQLTEAEARFITSNNPGNVTVTRSDTTMTITTAWIEV